MHKPESVRENETQKILMNFEIQTYSLIPVSKPDLLIIDKKQNFPYCGLYRSRRTQSENQNRGKHLDLSRELKKAMEHECDIAINCN